MGTEIAPDSAGRVLPPGETSPSPCPGERVIFLSHLQRGLGLLASNFFRQFLEFFGLQPHHLPANVLVFLSSFVYLFEAYLGIWPKLHH